MNKSNLHKKSLLVLSFAVSAIAVLFGTASLCSCALLPEPDTVSFYNPSDLTALSKPGNDYSNVESRSAGTQEVCVVADISEWTGEHILNEMIVNVPVDERNNSLEDGPRIVDYEEYSKLFEKWVSTSGKVAGTWRSYADSGCNFIIAAEGPTNTCRSFDIVDCSYVDGTVTVYAIAKSKANSTSLVTTLAIPTDLPVETPVEWKLCVKEQQEKPKSRSGPMGWDSGLLDKPMIYLYPENEIDVDVVLGDGSGDITVSYPKYSDGWHMTARPDGTLTDKDTGRSLYGLYYERESSKAIEMTGEGFVVAGEDSSAFLEEKLSALGLNEREAEEFIVYWLPQLEANEYNYIRFATPGEIEELLPLEITPAPDSQIRILMFFKPLDEPVPVSGQELPTPERDGFTLVEWGGIEIR